MPVDKQILFNRPLSVPRRRFVQGLTAGGIAAGLGLRMPSLLAAGNPTILRGNHFDLTLAETPVNFTGRRRTATTVNDLLPGPVLHWREGERVTLRVHNQLPEISAIHWHGIVLPYHMDGVPHISFNGIAPGATFTYEFDVKQSGTYWYHSHAGGQEQTGIYGALVIEPRAPEPFHYDRDYVLLLSDWTDADPADIYANLKKMSHYYNFNERTAADVWHDIRKHGAAETWRQRSMWNQMRMSERDLADVTGYTYTFLLNGLTPAEGWSGLFRRGERLRLRIINGAAMTFFDFRIPGLKLTVVAADGQNIEPVTVDEFRIGVAETYDVIVEPKHDTAYTIFAQALDRSGYARGILTPDSSLTAPLPDMDPQPALTHADMGMAAQNHNHAAAADIDHAAHGAHTQHAAQQVSGKAGYGSARPVMHAAAEYGPHVDMRAEDPQYRLDDPGVGLRNNGRRVLTYADLKNLHTTPDPREPTREIDLHLTGNMRRYMWSFNGVKHADAEPLHLAHGERVRINLINDSMMNHPIHLHGMWSDLETGDPQHIPRKHTVTVQPGARISYLVTADALGPWAYHCHLLYHMPGMMRTVVVGEASGHHDHE
jgi:CopA family copper-resistance protein